MKKKIEEMSIDELIEASADASKKAYFWSKVTIFFLVVALIAQLVAIFARLMASYG